MTNLRLIYRSYGGENLKGRPPYYSKKTALLSFLRAAERINADVVFINDGPISDEISTLQYAAGAEVVHLPHMGMRRSYLYALHYATSRDDWGPDDLVWFAEDDYLYHPDAFVHLQAAAEQLLDVDYLGLYGSRPRVGDAEVPKKWWWRTTTASGRDIRTWRPVTTTTASGHKIRTWRPVTTTTASGRDIMWARILSTASTFGIRVRAIREDLGIFKWCMVPHKTMYRDHDICVMIQGYPPHQWRDLANTIFVKSGRAPATWLRDIALTPFLAASNLRSHRHEGNCRIFMSAHLNLATHLETANLAKGTDWAQIAAETDQWGASHHA